MVMYASSDKECPWCGRRIRAEAAFCSHCNHDLEDDLLAGRRKTRRAAVLLVSVFAIALLAVLVAALIRR